MTELFAVLTYFLEPHVICQNLTNEKKSFVRTWVGPLISRILGGWPSGPFNCSLCLDIDIRVPRGHKSYNCVSDNWPRQKEYKISPEYRVCGPLSSFS